MKIFRYILLLFFIFVVSAYGADTNVAPNGTATQSSTATYDSITGSADKAIDGQTNGNWANKSVTHTKNTTPYEWWQVDLGSLQKISKITIKNRTDMGRWRLYNVWLMVSDTPFNPSTTLTSLDTSKNMADWKVQQTRKGERNTYDFTLSSPVVGRYVLIQKSGNNIDITNASAIIDLDVDVINMAEVQVFASPVSGADLRLSEASTPSPNPVNVGDEVTFKTKIRNYGTKTAAKDQVVKFSYNQDVTITSANHSTSTSYFDCTPRSGTLQQGQEITCTKASVMFANKERTITIKVKPTQAGTLEQTAVASSPTNDPDTSNNTLISKVTVNGTGGCTGCDCSYDTGANEANNDNSPGVKIVQLDGATASTQKCISGISKQSDSAHKDDYYYFDIGADGDITINTSSPNNHKYHLSVKRGNTYVYPDNANTFNHQVNFQVSAGDRVILHFKETGNDDDKYEATITFNPGNTSGNFTCANPKKFEKIFEYVGYTKLLMAGNTNLCADNDQDGQCDPNGPSSGERNNNIYMINNHQDAQINASAANLLIPRDSNGISKRVLWAGVFWQGMLVNKSEADKESAKRIKYKKEGESYNTIEADDFRWIYLDNQGDRFYYQGFKEITDYVKQHGGGYYWIADIVSTEGKPTGGSYGGWSIVVVYEDDANEKFKNTAVYYGYTAVSTAGDQRGANTYATANGCSTNPEKTGAANTVSVKLENFLTPKTGDVEASFSVFVGEGDDAIGNGWSGDEISVTDKNNGKHTLTNSLNPTGNIMNATITRDGQAVRDGKPYFSDNSLGVDIDTYDLTNILNNNQYETTITLDTGGDGYLPGVFSIETELRMIDLCYDYAYQQNGRYFTEENNGSKNPRLKGNLFSTDPITVSLFVKNREASDVVVKGMHLSVDPIITSEGEYIDASAQVTYPGASQRVAATVESSGSSYIRGMYIGDVGSEEHFYAYYDITPKNRTIDMPIYASLDFNTSITIPNGPTITTPYTDVPLRGKGIPFCADDNFIYAPVKSVFNVEHKDLNGKYNLYTQVTRRVDSFKVTAYDVDHLDDRVAVQTMVAVELIDVGAYHEVPTSCQEPDNILTPRVWVTFNDKVNTNFTKDTIERAIQRGKVSDQILNQTQQLSVPEDFYDVARRNAAFRVSYLALGENNTSIKVVKENKKWKIDNFNHINTAYPHCNSSFTRDPNGRTADYCDPSVTRTETDIATCMECLYGYNLKYVCSRDNFAIRPEAFKVSFSDDNTSTLNPDFANNTNRSGSSRNPINLVAGYPYRIDITATSHTDENNVSGYTQNFDASDPRKRAFMAWDPYKITPAEASANCNTPEDRNMTFYLVHGTNTNQNPFNTWEDRHDTLDNVGEYTFKIFDREWTKYDWDPALLRHHTINANHFLSNSDCKNGNKAPSIPDPYKSSKVKAGCYISSVHTTASGTTYSKVNVESYPYQFDVSGLHIGARPQNVTSNTFVYINTLDRTTYPNATEDENMSYNVQGTFGAIGYDGKSLDNFVTGCYAEDVTMKLLHTIMSSPAPVEDMQYDLFDYNTSATVHTNAALPANNTIDQTEDMFTKPMKGKIKMDLGFNYNRTYNTPIDPIYITMQDFNISLASQPSSLFVKGKNDHKIFGNKDIDQNVTFIYGRAKSEKFFYDNITTNSVTTPITIVAYCNLGLTLCQNRGLDVITDATLSDTISNESQWWIVHKHNTSNGDGKVTLSASNGSVNPTDPAALQPTDGIDSSVTVTNSTNVTPNIVDIDFGTDSDRWVIFNKGSDAIPSPFYKVRFIGTSGWTGEGETGHVVGDDINTKKIKRLEW